MTQGSQLKTPRSILKNSFVNKEEDQDETLKLKQKHVDDDFFHNRGDDDLAPYFQPKLIESKGKIEDIEREKLLRLRQLG